MDILTSTTESSLRDRARLYDAALIRAAATLRLADLIDDEGSSLDDIVRDLGSDRSATRALLFALVEVGMLATTGERRFVLTEAGSVLRSDHPHSIRYALDRHGVFARSDIALLFLDHTILTGAPGFDALGGRTFWEDCSDDDALEMQPPQNGALAMDGDVIVSQYPWHRATQVLDVGGNVGALAHALVAAHPHLTVGVLDLPGIAAATADRFASSPHRDRLHVVAGSFFDPLPPAEVYVLSAILGDWDDDGARRILASIARSMAPHSRLLIADAHVPLSGPREELYLRCMMPSPSRSIDEIIALAADAGLSLTWRGIGTSVRSLLEFQTMREGAAS